MNSFYDNFEKLNCITKIKDIRDNSIVLNKHFLWRKGRSVI